MINFNNKCLALSAVCLLSITSIGCLRTYYPMYFYSSPLPVVNETDSNIDMGSNYLDVDFIHSDGGHDGEITNMLRGSYTYANTQRFTNFNLSFFGFGGSYKVFGLDHESGFSQKTYDGLKNNLGLGADMKLGANFKFGNIKVGLGSNVGIVSEFGEYTNFRLSATQDERIHSEQRTLFYTVNLFPYFVYQFSETTILSAQLNLGTPGFASPIVAVNQSGKVYWLCLVTDFKRELNKINFGVMVELNEIFNYQ